MEHFWQLSEHFWQYAAGNNMILRSLVGRMSGMYDYIQPRPQSSGWSMYVYVVKLVFQDVGAEGIWLQMIFKHLV